MSVGVVTMRIVIWITVKSLNILYIPIFIARMFKRSKICPPIRDDVLLLPAIELADKIRKQEVTRSLFLPRSHSSFIPFPSLSYPAKML